MKVSEFRELCMREYGQACGDVVGLALTDESYIELLHSVITSSERYGLVPGGENELLNPATGSIVKPAKGASTDSAEVYRHYGNQQLRASHRD